MKILIIFLIQYQWYSKNRISKWKNEIRCYTLILELRTWTRFNTLVLIHVAHTKTIKYDCMYIFWGFFNLKRLQKFSVRFLKNSVQLIRSLIFLKFLILATWHSQPMRKRLRERQSITARLRSISWKPCLRNSKLIPHEPSMICSNSFTCPQQLVPKSERNPR